MGEYLQLSVDTPGRYFLKRQSDDEIIIVNFQDSIYHEREEAIQFYKQGDRNYLKTERVQSQSNHHAIQQEINNIQTKIEGINLFYQVSGSFFESLLLHQVYQMLIINPKELFRFYFLEDVYLSPDFKNNIKKLHKSYNFEYIFINFKYPEQILYKDIYPLRHSMMSRILFIDQLFPQNIERIMYKDADQCIYNHTIVSDLFNIDLQNHATALVPHCNYFYKRNRQLIFPENRRNETYYVNALYIADLTRFRGEQKGQKMRTLYKQKIGDKGVDSFFLMQDFQNYAQISVEIISLDQKWLWSEDFCDPKLKNSSQFIDFQVYRPGKESKFNQAQRVCPGFQDTFDQLVNILLNDNRI